MHTRVGRCAGGDMRDRWERRGKKGARERGRRERWRRERGKRKRRGERMG